MTLSPDTKITLGAAIACVGVSITATWWFSTKLETIATRFGAVEQALSEKFTIATASEQALRLAIENPGLRVPDPRDPKQVIVVTGERR